MRRSEQHHLIEQICRIQQHPDRRARIRHVEAEWLSGMFLGSSLCSFFPTLNLVKWATYGDNGRGYALVFRRSSNWIFDVHGQHFVEHAPRVRLIASPVQYLADFPEIDLDADWYESENGWDAIRRGLLSKLEQWKHEEELRVIRPGVGPGEQRFSKGDLVAVVLGHNATEAVESRFVDLSQRRRPSIPILKSQVVPFSDLLTFSQLYSPETSPLDRGH